MAYQIVSRMLEDRFRYLLLLAFLVIGLLAMLDIVADLREGTDFVHIMIEVVVFVVAISGAIGLFLRLLAIARSSRQQVELMSLELQQNQDAARQWREEAQGLLRGLGASINKQFERWQLTASEKETALFLLKGLSHKEVAGIRGVSEATARQQAGAIYRKAGLGGRHDLSAFFLEDLALPPTEGQP